MTTMQQIIDTLELSLLTNPRDFSQVGVESGYASDLLSCVMSGAQSKGVWVTLQSHVNVVAVAALLDLSAVIITESAMPDESVIAKANLEGVSLFSTPYPTYFIAGKLWEMGVQTE